MKQVDYVLVMGLSLFLTAKAEQVPESATALLDKHVAILHKFCGSSCGQNMVDFEGFLRDNSALLYRHELIRLGLKKIAIMNTLTPLFECWDHFKKEYHLEEELFVHEYSIMLFLAYKNILIRFSVAKVSIADIIKLSAQIASLPVDQVLTALEHCYHQFMIIMHQYGIQSGVSLAVWIRQYWWVPPVVLLSLLYTIAAHFLTGGSSSSPDLDGDLNSLLH